MTIKYSLLALVAAVAVAMMVPSVSSAASEPSQDPFYSYTGSAPLSSYAPGDVLKTRKVSYHIVGLATPLKATQLLYRANDALGRPTVNVTSVIQPSCFLCLNREKVLAYQSFYDSLNPADEPSWSIQGGVTLGGMIPNIETALFAPYLLQGFTIVITDTQGQKADFAAGPEYGTNTLDGIRAAIRSSSVDLSSKAKVAMMGYSGGAIATEWASELAPTYAPDLSKNLIGAAYGGVLVNPAHNLPYVEGTPFWAGVAGMAIVGIARAYGIDLSPYVNDRGRELLPKFEKASIANVLGQYGGMYFKDIVKPEYARPNSIPEFVTYANKVIMGTGGTPRIPQFVGQGTGGELEGTPGDKPGIGKGDGVMIAGDVRTLLRGYCSKGTKVQYNEYPGSHITSALQWLPQAIGWINDRFSWYGPWTVPNNCGSIKPGNPLTPLVYTP